MTVLMCHSRHIPFPPLTSQASWFLLIALNPSYSEFPSAFMAHEGSTERVVFDHYLQDGGAWKVAMRVPCFQNVNHCNDGAHYLGAVWFFEYMIIRSISGVASVASRRSEDRSYTPSKYLSICLIQIAHILMSISILPQRRIWSI